MEPVYPRVECTLMKRGNRFGTVAYSQVCQPTDPLLLLGGRGLGRTGRVRPVEAAASLPSPGPNRLRSVTLLSQNRCRKRNPGINLGSAGR